MRPYVADISGFTPLTARFAREGPAGAEKLTGILNTYFGQLIELITSYWGDVLKFAGDALIAIWQDGTKRRRRFKRDELNRDMPNRSSVRAGDSKTASRLSG